MEDAHSTAQSESVGSPGPARTTRVDDAPSARDVTKRSTKIHTPAEARACLLDAQLIDTDDTLTHDTLAGALVQTSLFPGLSQAAKDAICSVAILLAQTKLADDGGVEAEGLAGRVMDKVAEAVKAVTQAAISEVKAASTMLTESSTQIAATTTSYRDALTKTTANPVAVAASMDARVRAREGVKARQILVDALTPNQQLHQGANNLQLVSLANAALNDMEDPPSHRFVGARRLNNGGLLLEMDSEEAATWLSGSFAKAAFLGRFAPEAALKSRTYSLVIQFVPLHFKPGDVNELRALEDLNGLPPNALLRARWIKPPYRRAAEQTCGHVLAVMTRPEDANKILTDGLIVCQKRVYAEKCKKEPTRCLKCHGWGHMSYDCQQPFSVCGTCAGRHRTPECCNRDKPRCTSCHVDGHPSWDRRCPTFLSKCHEMDARLTENQMPYYPTADPWTHVLRPLKPAPLAPESSQAQRRPWSRTAGATRPTSGSQPRPYRQATLNFPPAQGASQGNGAAGSGVAGPRWDEEGGEMDGPSSSHPV